MNYQEKLRVAKQLEGVTALGKVFQFPLAPGIGQASKADDSGIQPVKIEVDVVANDGNAWVQVRSVRITDVNSLHWIGMPGHHKVDFAVLMGAVLIGDNLGFGTEVEGLDDGVPGVCALDSLASAECGGLLLGALRTRCHR